MAKILACLIAFMLIAAMLFGIRWRRLAITSSCALLTHRIQQQTHKLWDQQILIARHANPRTLSRELKALTAAAPSSRPAASTTDESVVVPQPVDSTTP